jgi:hypothetical protein
MFYAAPYSTRQQQREPAVVWRKISSTPIAGLVLDEVKTFINRPLEDTFWDGETTGLIMVAQAAIEQWCHVSLAPSVWLGTMPSLLDQQIIVRRPFDTVTKIEVVDPDSGEIIAVDPALYQVAPVAQLCGQLLIGDADEWPDYAVRQDAFRVTVETKFLYVDASNNPTLPTEIRHALCMTVAALDANRGDGSQGGGGLANTVYGATHSNHDVIPATAQVLLAPYRYMSLYTS